MDIKGKWTNLHYWKKGAILGFLFIPLLFLIGSLLMLAAAVIQSETFAGIIDGLVMLANVPALVILKRFENVIGITFATILLTSTILWTFFGAMMGYIIDKRKPSKIINIRGD